MQVSMQKLSPDGATWDVYRVRFCLTGGAVYLFADHQTFV